MTICPSPSEKPSIRATASSRSTKPPRSGGRVPETPERRARRSNRARGEKRMKRNTYAGIAARSRHPGAQLRLALFRAPVPGEEGQPFPDRNGDMLEYEAI